MDYLKEINAFERWCENNYLPISSQLLWYKFMQRFNRNGWCEWVSVDNLTLMAAMQMSREATLIKVRDELVKAGLIEFQKGKKGTPNRYRMIPFEKNTFKNEVKSVVETVVESAVKSVVETAVETVDIKDKHKTKTIKKSIPDGIPEKQEPCPGQVATIRELYHSVCGSYPRLANLSEARCEAIRARLRSGYGMEDFRRLFEKAEASDFLRGKNSRNWRATFDWLIKAANMAKVLEGNYDNYAERTRAASSREKPGGKENRFHNLEPHGYDYDAMVWKMINSGEECLGEVREGVAGIRADVPGGGSDHP